MGTPGEEFLTDTVTLTKQTGEIFNDIKALVDKKNIFIFDSTLDIEEGDVLLRELPNGRVEEYVVTDRGYYEKFGSIDAHYQCEVEKKTSQKFKEPNISVTFNGPNSRYNHHSTDNSTNIYSNESGLFEEMKKIIDENVEDLTEKTALLENVESMEITQGTSTFKDKYNEFIVSLGNHMTLLQPFIPKLTELLMQS